MESNRLSNNIISSPQSAVATINGRQKLLFGSNCYLSLADNEEVISHVFNAIKKYGLSSGGSRFISGNYELNLELERRLAEYEEKESAVVFNSGYATNVGAISALCGEFEIIFSDELNHASIIDGLKLGRGNVVIYKHCDVDDLNEKIKAYKNKKGLIITDSIFSMDGDLAPLPNLLSIAHSNNALVMIDEAHSLGVLGRGLYSYYKISPKEIDIIMGTLSKAVASEGGFVCADNSLVDIIRKKARSLIFSTASSPAILAASIGGLNYICKHQEIIAKLQNNIEYFKNSTSRAGFATRSESAIIPIIIGNAERTRAISRKLYEMDIFVPAIVYPAVKEGSERLRFSLCAAHTFEQLDHVSKCLKEPFY